MNKSFLEQFVEDPKQMRAYQQELLILAVTNRICELMEEQKVTRADLARRLGTTKGYITQLLDGRSNITLRKLADVMGALGCAAELHTKRIAHTVRPGMRADVRKAN